MDELFTQAIEFAQGLRGILWERWEKEDQSTVLKDRFPKLLNSTAMI
jgi:hypothetical protein